MQPEGESRERQWRQWMVATRATPNGDDKSLDLHWTLWSKIVVAVLSALICAGVLGIFSLRDTVKALAATVNTMELTNTQAHKDIRGDIDAWQCSHDEMASEWKKRIEKIEDGTHDH